MRGVKKKVSYYDKEQYRDQQGNLLFFRKHHVVGGITNVYSMLNIYDEEVVFISVNEAPKELTKVQYTYKDIVDAVCRYYDFSHRKPKGFSVEIRCQAINLCMNYAYSEICKEGKPTIQNLGDIFGLSVANLINMDRLYLKSLETDTEKKQKFEDLLKYITSLNKNADFLTV